MFRLRSLELDNFGPFKGRQRIEFPKDDGVVMIFGENMRGKTTLLNAIRFAFFGKFVGRGSRQIPLWKVGNWEAAEQGKHGFEVRLDLTYENVPYTLTRSFHLKPGVNQPESDDDFRNDYYLERDGVMLSPQDAKREMERILPEQISRFFLFDGELLQEYEDLLLSDSAVGERIAAAIERILGMPVLTGARTTLSQVRDIAAKEQATAAQGDQKTQQLGIALSGVLANGKTFTENLEKFERDLAEARKSKGILEEAMRRSERSRGILERRDYVEAERLRLEQRLAADRLTVQAAMGGAWAVVLHGKMRAALEGLRGTQRQLQGEVLQARVIRDLIDRHLQVCPTCQQSLDDPARHHLSTLAENRNSRPDDHAERSLATIDQRIAALEKTLAGVSPEALRLQMDAVAQTERELYGKIEELKELTTQLASIDEDELRQVRHDFETVIKTIKTLEDGIEETRKAIAENDSRREGIQSKLARFTGNSAEEAREFFQMTTDLFNLMDESVALYRDRLRHRVQEDASRHFRGRTTEPEYSGLRINDSYGLSIVHQDGSEIPLRSAGAEHIVALSLVAALQNNAPLRGPIIIDSPLVRLDSGHKENIMKALPTLASQVLMLVYEDEISPARARKALAGSLKKELKLARRSARHTEIVENVDAGNH
jgi:DNA sulfur modification protein DndD